MSKKTDEEQIPLFQSLGGKARAKKLSAEERREIAKVAADARWSNRPDQLHWPKATHEGPLKIGDATIECAVLQDGTRVINQRSFLKAIKRSPNPTAGRGSETLKQAFDENYGVEELPPFLPA